MVYSIARARNGSNYDRTPHTAHLAREGHHDVEIDPAEVAHLVAVQASRLGPLADAPHHRKKGVILRNLSEGKGEAAEAAAAKAAQASKSSSSKAGETVFRATGVG